MESDEWPESLFRKLRVDGAPEKFIALLRRGPLWPSRRKGDDKLCWALFLDDQKDCLQKRIVDFYANEEEPPPTPSPWKPAFVSNFHDAANSSFRAHSACVASAMHLNARPQPETFDIETAQSVKIEFNEQRTEEGRILWMALFPNCIRTSKVYQDLIAKKLEDGDRNFFLHLLRRRNDSVNSPMLYSPLAAFIARFWTDPDAPLWLMSHNAAVEFINACFGLMGLGNDPATVDGFRKAVGRLSLRKSKQKPIREISLAKDGDVIEITVSKELEDAIEREFLKIGLVELLKSRAFDRDIKRS